MSQYQPPAYRPPRAYQPSQPPPHPYYQQQPVQHVVHHYHAPPGSPAVAVMLEFLPGFFIYAGNAGVGLLFMFGYRFVTFVNLLLCFLLVGFITWPLRWLATMVTSSVLASKAASRAAAYR